MTVAVVTGASRGLGRAIAVEAARRGYDLVLAARSDLGPTRRDVEDEGRTAVVVQGDLADADHVGELADASTAAGPVGLLVNNAGVTNSGPLDEVTLDRWDATVRLNLTAPAMLSKLLAHPLQATNGAIVNIGSTGALAGSFHSLPYGATKAGVIGLTKTLARMLAPHVRVNAVHPGPIATELLAGVGSDGLAATVAATPLGRLGEPHEIANVVLDISAWTYCTGQSIVVDGGKVML